MCNIIDPSNREFATGYKYVIEQKGKFYSPYSGMKYKVGKIPLNFEKIEPTLRLINDKRMIGKTGVILKPFYSDGSIHDDIMGDVDLIKLEGFKVSLIEMTITGDLFDTVYVGEGVIGNTIVAFEKVMDL